MPSQNYNLPVTVEVPPVRPTAIVVSVSGGKDSTELLRRIMLEYLEALGWNDVPVICHHQVVEEDWSGTLDYCQQICDFFGVPLHLSRARYHGYICTNALCGFQTLSVRERESEPAREGEGEAINCKCAKCDQPTLEKIAEVTNLRELMRWRKAYPSSKVRFCTSYLKRDVFNLWVRQNRHLLGATPVVAMGERWAESPGRKKLPVVRLRESVSTKDFQMYEWRPILHLSRQQVFRGILLGEGEGTSAGEGEGEGAGVNVSAPGVVGVARMTAKANGKGGVLDVHPCYYAQGLTRQQMLDENVEGGPRMSCVFCFYNTDKQLQINGQLPQNRELLESFIRTEEEIGYTIRQGVSLKQIVGG
jgi:hypothetical protein